MIFFKVYLLLCVIFYVKLTKPAEQLGILKIVVNNIKKIAGNEKIKRVV